MEASRVDYTSFVFLNVTVATNYIRAQSRVKTLMIAKLEFLWKTENV